MRLVLRRRIGHPRDRRFRRQGESRSRCAPRSVERKRAATVPPVYVLAMEVDVRIESARSLKDKRQVVKSLVEGARLASKALWR